MDTAFRDRQVKRVTKIANAAAQLLGMTDHFELTWLWDEGMDGEDTGELHHTCAVTVAHWQYRRAKIRWYLEAAAALPDDRLFATAVHELVHVLLDPIQSLLPESPEIEGDDDVDLISDLNEYTTESVTRAILAASGRTPA